ncbi:MAG: YceI family protein [Candidatus Nanopelagicales bacterium]
MTVTTLDTTLDQTTGTWVIDPSHSRVGFSAKHAMVTTVRGQFNQFEGALTLDGANPAASAAALTIQSASFSTGSDDRDNHVRSADFLDVENHPTLTFASTDVRHIGGHDFVIAGDLAIRGDTRPVELKVEFEGLSTDPFGNDRIGFSGSTVISRKDFGLTWNVALEAGGVLVSDKVKITLDVAAIKQA